MPQGDALSPVALNAIMAAASRFVAQNLQNGERSITDLDNRDFPAANFRRAAVLCAAWGQTMERLGFKENVDKT